MEEIQEQAIPSVGEVRNAQRKAKLKAETTTAKLFNGREVEWKRIVVPAGQVEEKTIVFGDNERSQLLLSAESVADITDTLSPYGNDKAAIGRINKDGLIETADGSRRRYACIEKVTPYNIDVTDLTDEEMLHLSLTGNIYRKPSVYEQGQRYINLQESLGLNDSQLEKHLTELGEKTSRRKINRYKFTASLPVEIIQAFEIPNDCSADFGEKLYRVWKDQEENSLPPMEDRAIKIRMNRSEYINPKQIFNALFGEAETTKKINDGIEKLHKHVTAKTLKNGNLSMEFSSDIDAERLAEIKEFIQLNLVD